LVAGSIELKIIPSPIPVFLVSEVDTATIMPNAYNADY